VESAEALLRGLGLRQVRVRYHGSLARIEVEPGEFEHVIESREQIAGGFKEIGFTHTALDLTGYRTGSMNEALKEGVARK
jgi:uncharacterized protein